MALGGGLAPGTVITALGVKLGSHLLFIVASE